MGLLGRWFGGGDELDKQKKRTAEVLDHAIARARLGRALDERVLQATGDALDQLYEAMCRAHGTESNLEFSPEDRADFYAEAVKGAALGHPSHGGWPHLSDLREKVLHPLRRSALEANDPWRFFAAIQPALAEGQVALAKHFYARIEADAYLRELALRWATLSMMEGRTSRERRAAEELLQILPTFEPWNEPSGPPDPRRWILLTALHPALTIDPRWTLATTEPPDVVARGLGLDWDVVDRHGAVDTIDTLVRRGHREELARHLRGAPIHDPARRRFIDAHREALGRREIQAWDLGRAVSVARAAAALGWLSEREAWDVLEQIGARIAGAYRSWEEYGEDFALGWGYFRPLQADEGPAQLARWLASDARSPWRRVPFGG